jgi:hypothetical protein
MRPSLPRAIAGALTALAVVVLIVVYSGSSDPNPGDAIAGPGDAIAGDSGDDPQVNSAVATATQLHERSDVVGTLEGAHGQGVWWIVAVDADDVHVEADICVFDDDRAVASGRAGPGLPYRLDPSKLELPLVVRARSPDGLRRGRLELTGEPDEGRIVLRLDDTGVIAGRVVLGDGVSTLAGLRVCAAEQRVRERVANRSSPEARSVLMATCLTDPDGRFLLTGLDESQTYVVEAGGMGYATNEHLSGSGLVTVGTEIELTAWPVYAGELRFADSGLAEAFDRYRDDWPWGIRIGGWPDGGRALPLNRHLAFAETGVAEQLEALRRSNIRYSAFTTPVEQAEASVVVTSRVPFVRGDVAEVLIPRLVGDLVPIAWVDGLQAAPAAVDLFIDFVLPTDTTEVPDVQVVAEVVVDGERGYVKRRLFMSELREGIRLGGLPAGRYQIEVRRVAGRSLILDADLRARMEDLLVQGDDIHLLVDLTHTRTLELDPEVAIALDRPVSIELRFANERTDAGPWMSFTGGGYLRPIGSRLFLPLLPTDHELYFAITRNGVRSVCGPFDLGGLEDEMLTFE